MGHGLWVSYCQPKTISPTELLLNSHLLLTNTFGGRMHVAEKNCQIESLAEEGLTDLLSPFSSIVFSHITLLLMALWRPVMDV